MNRRFYLVLGMITLALGIFGNAAALEKFKYGMSFRLYPGYYLPFFAAEEKGHWKENGLEAELVPFRGGAALMAAAASGHINMGVTMAPTIVQAAAAGAPVLIAANLYPKGEFFFWARTAGRFKEPKDLKGAKIGVHQLGTTSHALGRLVLKELGLEKETKFVGAGGIPETVAALKTGAIDVASGYTIFEFVKLEAAGEVFPLVRISDYLPKEWLDHILFARKEFLKTNADTGKRVVRAILQGMNFIARNPAWAVQKIKAEQGFSDEEVRLVMEREGLRFAKDGKIDRKAVENIRDFLIRYDIVSKDKAPPVEQLYTSELTD